MNIHNYFHVHLNFFHAKINIFRCVRQERISITEGLSVRGSVGMSVTPVQKPRFLAVFGHGEILHWNKWSTNMFWESFHPSVRPSVSPYICHMINTRWDTARTHRCPVGLVTLLLLPNRSRLDCRVCGLVNLFVSLCIFLFKPFHKIKHFFVRQRCRLVEQLIGQ